MKKHILLASSLMLSICSCESNTNTSSDANTDDLPKPLVVFFDYAEITTTGVSYFYTKSEYSRNYSSGETRSSYTSQSSTPTLQINHLQVSDSSTMVVANKTLPRLLTLGSQYIDMSDLPYTLDSNTMHITLTGKEAAKHIRTIVSSRYSTDVSWGGHYNTWSIDRNESWSYTGCNDNSRIDIKLYRK